MPDFDDLLLDSDAPFAFGAARYWDALPGFDESPPRVYVRFRPDGMGREQSFLALLDTGAHYCILNTGLAVLIRDQLGDSIGSVRLRTAHGPVDGKLYRHRIAIVAEVGRDLEVETTVFIPPGWTGPNFLGYLGALDRLRFALDPSSNRFFFGPLD